MKQPEDTYTIDMFATQPCVCCGESVPVQRAQLGYKTCLVCGDKQARAARHTVVPMAKSNYVVVTDLQLLKGLNKYANT